ncbi:DUF2156 domain-containing protein [Myxococcaceae bacterium GXIMD 01537]
MGAQRHRQAWDGRAERERVLALLKRHGWNATSFQVLDEGFQYWFDPSAEACVAYVDTGRAWVVAGAPVAPDARLEEVTSRFAAEARGAGRRVCFFATEPRFAAAVPVETLTVGEQPVWEPSRWEETVRASRNLREQLRRARAKGVTVRAVGPAELADAGHPTRHAVDRLMARWLESRSMAPMGFLVQLSPYAFVEERRAFVAELRGEVVGFLSAVPVYAREGWFLQDLLRDPQAPNGTPELLVDAALRAAHAEGRGYVTLGLAPLAGEVPPWLRVAREWGTPLYDFEGLRAFKAKFRPHAWHPVHLSWPQGGGGLEPLFHTLTAFARGSLVRFGWDTLRRRPGLLMGLAARLPLLPWRPLAARERRG